MSLKKALSVLLIVSQFAAVSAMAAPGASPEVLMLRKVLASEGQSLSSDVLQTRVTETVTQYMSTAPVEGRQERLQQAFVDLGIYTPAQAQAYMSDAEKAAQSADSSKAMTAEIMHLAEIHPAGAQFSMSNCDVGRDLMIGGAVAAIVGGLTRSVGTCQYSSPNSTTCDLGASYPHMQAGDNEIIAGGVLAAIGGVILIMNRNGC